MKPDVQYDDFIGRLVVLDRAARQRAVQATNLALTARNWLWGAHLFEYEQGGEPRAPYGKKVLERIAADLASRGARIDHRNLQYFRQFALNYAAPPILNTLCSQFESWLLADPATLLSPKANTPCSSSEALAFPKLAQREPQSLDWQDDAYYLRLFSSLSWSHFRELMRIDAGLERAFYEVETLKNQWSVRELKRQRATQLYQRVGLSKDKAAVLRFATTGEHADTPATIVRDPYVIEFLGLPELPAYTESDLEQRLMDHLQRFLTELGTDFALIGRQKRITIDGQHYYIDLLSTTRASRPTW